MASELDWMASAACKGMPAEMFILDRGTPAGPGKAVCNTPCAVRKECGEYGKANNLVGIWGGEVLKYKRPPKSVEVLTELDPPPTVVATAPSRRRSRKPVG